ncbi:MAG: hypothetical protein K0S72_1528, partial [Arthrobacter sp.]|nr:hypothetical protein [Arthrobacter sp.]
MEPHRKPGFANRWRSLHSAGRRQAVLGGLLAAAFVVAALQPAVRNVIIGLEVAFVGITALWGLLHPRSVAPAFSVAFRWAFWLGLGGTVWFAAAVPEEVRRAFGFEPPAWAILAGCPVVFLLGLVAATLGGTTFAALGAWLTRRAPDGRRSAQAAVSLGWIVVLVRWFADLSDYPVLAQAAHLAAPLGVPLVCWLAARARMEGEGLAAATSNWLTGVSRRLVIRSRGGAAVRDLRGLALGALGGVAALLLSVGPGHPLASLQYQALEGLVRLRNEPFAAATSPTKRPPNVEEDWRRRIVLVRLDPATRARIGKRSEASVIAETVDRLAKYGPLRIVAPLPHLEAS